MTKTRKLCRNIKFFLFDYEFYGMKIKLPFAHYLPEAMRVIPRYSDCIISEIEKICRERHSVPIIDIGANIGDTAIMISTVTENPILAIEPDGELFEYLKSNTVNKNVVAVKRAVDDVNTLDNLLENYPLFKNAKFVKIDTEGCDLKILIGAKELLKRSKPVIFFEYDPKFYKNASEYLSFFSYLNKFGYTTFKFCTRESDVLTTLKYPRDIGIIDDISRYALQAKYFYFDIVAS